MFGRLALIHLFGGKESDRNNNPGIPLPVSLCWSLAVYNYSLTGSMRPYHKAYQVQVCSGVWWRTGKGALSETVTVDHPVNNKNTISLRVSVCHIIVDYKSCMPLHRQVRNNVKCV